MAKASKKPTPKKQSKYHEKIKVNGTPDEILKAMLNTPPKKKGDNG